MKKIIAVASGKGGVGKSTIACNLAVALANSDFATEKNNAGTRRKLNVALVDLDFYGPSIPTIMGGGKFQLDNNEKIIPPLKHGVKYISIGFFLKNPDDPIIWRGPMFSKAINQLFNDVSWGDVDICIVDMPPGTGDAQLSLAQQIQLAGAIVVTTPQELSLADVRRSINMFAKVNVPILGIVENMAGFAVNGEVIEIFGKGGGKALSESYKLDFLGSLPIDVETRKASDSGNPVALSLDSSFTLALNPIVQAVFNKVSPQEVGNDNVQNSSEETLRIFN